MTSFRQISGLAAAFLALQSGVALASEFGPGHSGRGFNADKYGLKNDASIGYYDDGSGSNIAGYYGNLSFGAPIGGDGASGSIGAQFGAYLELHTLKFDSFSETSLTGGLVFGGDQMQVIAGVPTAAVEDYVARPALAGTKLIDFLSLGFGVAGSVTKFGQVGVGEDNYGLRYDAQYDGFQFGISLHDFPDSDLSTATAGAQFASGNLLFGVGTEIAQSSGADLNSWFGSVDADYDIFNVGLYLQLLDDGSSDVRTVQLSGGFNPTERISLEAQYMDIDGTSTVVGLSAAYSLTDQISVNGGYIDFDGSSNVAFVELSILNY